MKFSSCSQPRPMLSGRAFLKCSTLLEILQTRLIVSGNTVHSRRAVSDERWDKYSVDYVEVKLVQNIHQAESCKTKKRSEPTCHFYGPAGCQIFVFPSKELLSLIKDKLIQNKLRMIQVLEVCIFLSTTQSSSTHEYSILADMKPWTKPFLQFLKADGMGSNVSSPHQTKHGRTCVLSYDSYRFNFFSKGLQCNYYMKSVPLVVIQYLSVKVLKY